MVAMAQKKPLTPVCVFYTKIRLWSESNLLEKIAEAELREICRIRLENVERWLRRLVHEELSKHYPNYLQAKRPDGARVIKTRIAKDAQDRRDANPERYPRDVDAFLLDDLVDVVSNPLLYPYFRLALRQAFPDGRDEAQTFLKRLIAPRNALAHANQLTLRSAEQIVCYSGDIIASLKTYYRDIGMENDYNVPTILRVSDNIGNSFERSQLSIVHDGGVGMFLAKKVSLRPGDVLTLEIEIDPSFDPTTYDIRWASVKPMSADRTDSHRIIINITESIVAQEWTLQFRITTKNSWHRMEMGADDFLLLSYRILPPIWR